MSAYDLRADVRGILDSTSLTDPGEIADKVLENVPAKSMRAALRVTLRSYVRSVMSETRTYRPDADQMLSDHHTMPVGVGSWRRDGTRELWRRHLADRFHVGGQQWKQLRDMTHDDLIAAANERRLNAARNEVWAAQFESWAHLLHEHKAATFGDLPEQMQAKALGATR